MATKIIHKKSSVIEKVPLTTDLEVGEIAINLADKKLYTKDTGSNIISLGNTEEQKLPIRADVILAKGDVLYATGTVGASGKITVNKFIANNTLEELYVIGVAEKDFAVGDTGFAVTFGEIRQINTTGSTVSETWVDGTILYSSSTTSGKLTSTAPAAPNQTIPVAIVVRAHATTGILFIRPTTGFHLAELHDVSSATPTNGQPLTWNSTTSVWNPSSTITASTTGSAATLTTARTIAISGDVTGTATSFNGGANISISSAITAGAIVNADVNASAGIVDTKLATISTAGKVSNSATTATNANTASAIVARDASGNFSAGTVTAALSGNATTATALASGGADRIKLDGIAAGAQVNVATNIAQGTRTTTTVPITSSTGTGATLDIATTSLAGVMSSADKTKLDGIAASANNYTLPAATSTVRGGVELFSDTVQSVAANAVSATASRSYGVQVNSDGQAVVNVPWTDTDTNTTYSAGNGISLAGTVFSVAAGTGLTQDTSGLSLTGITAGAATIGAVRYNGTTKTAGQFDGSTTAPTNTTRLNYDGYLYATRFYGDGSQLTGITATDSTKLPLAGGTMTGAITFAAGQTWPTFNQNTTGSAATLTTARTIATSGAATGTATSFNGSVNISIPITDLNASNLSSGTVPDARLTGTYSGFTHKLDGVNTVFTTPNTGSPVTAARTVYGLAEYKSNSNAQIGAIVFIAPTTNSTIMHQLEVQGMLYNQNIFRMTVQGYRTTGAWSDTRKISFGTVDVQTRWAVTPDGKNCLILGDVGTSWSYPHFSIVRGMFSYIGVVDAYCSGWTVATVTDLTGYTQLTATIADSTLVGSVSGNAATATILQTTRTINGVNFNGSANITVADATKLPLAGGTMTGALISRGNTAAFNSANDTTISVRSSDASAGAIMSFHRPSAYAVNFGLDTDNIMKLGGWSALSVRHSWDMLGNYIATGDVNSTSDERLKENWRTLPKDFLESLSKVKYGIYDRTDTDLTQAGVSAQDMQKVLEEVVKEDSNGMLSVNYGNAALVAVIELTKRVLLLEEELKKNNSMPSSKLKLKGE
jgi:hypothetical protein